MACSPPTPRATRQPPPYPDLGPVRVTLIDDDELTSHGLISMLRGHPEQIELVRLSQSHDPPVDIALYDHALRRQSNGPTLVQLLSDPRIDKVVLYTWNSQPQAATALLGQGASDYLFKALSGAELVEALRAVKSDQGRVPPSGRLIRADNANHTEYGEVLTDRESEMLNLISRGYSNAEIAGSLNLSINTVKSYIRSCYRKIDVDSRSKALLWGLRHGFGDSPSGSVPKTTPSIEEWRLRRHGLR